MQSNAGYLYAAYALAAFVYAGYAAVLVRRRGRARRALARDVGPSGAPKGVPPGVPGGVPGAGSSR